MINSQLEVTENDNRLPKEHLWATTSEALLKRSGGYKDLYLHWAVFQRWIPIKRLEKNFLASTKGKMKLYLPQWPTCSIKIKDYATGLLYLTRPLKAMATTTSAWYRLYIAGRFYRFWKDYPLFPPTFWRPKISQRFWSSSLCWNCHVNSLASCPMEAGSFVRQPVHFTGVSGGKGNAPNIYIYIYIYNNI